MEVCKLLLNLIYIGAAAALPISELAINASKHSGGNENGIYDQGQIMINSDLFGGDMLNDPNSARDNIWPGGIVPYEIHSSLRSHRSKLTRAFEEYHEKTCIKFRAKSTRDRNYIRLQDSTEGCNSYVGRVNIVPQPVNLQISGCLSHSTIVHELGHAVGFGHTHQRTDRDDFITIHLENVASRYRSAFNKERGGRNLVSYDTKSVMHYDSYAASTNGQPTIRVKGGGLISDPPGLSASDVRAIKILYKC